MREGRGGKWEAEEWGKKEKQYLHEILSNVKRCRENERPTSPN